MEQSMPPERPPNSRTLLPATLLAVALTFLPRLLAAEALVLQGVNVIPMDREIVLEDMTVVVENGRIAALGASDWVAVPSSARRVEAGGAYLLPGLVEMHVHLRERSVVGRYLAHGFTTVRDMNGRLGDTLAWRAEVEAGTLAGPRIFAAGPTLQAGAPEDDPYRVATPTQAREAVRKVKAAGYDLVKVYRVEREPFFALMDEARQQNIPVAGHHPDVIHDGSYEAPLDLTTEEVTAAGMVSLEHLDELVGASLRMELDRARLRPLAELLRAGGTAVTTLLGQDFLVQAIRRQGPTYLTGEREAEIRSTFGEEAVARTRQQIDFIASKVPRNIQDLGAAIPKFSLLMLRTFHEAGVDLLIGTDSHNPLVPAGRSALDEMDLFVEAGLRPWDALRTATWTAAKVLGELTHLGSVAVGKEADLLLVESNPLDDLATLRRPVGVIARGRYYDRAALAALRRGSAEAATSRP
jgi:imidazolonepropionase-like amidohydrolase